MTTGNLLLQDIYSHDKANNFKPLEMLLIGTFSSWGKNDKWSEIDTVLYAIDIRNINRLTAILLLKYTCPYKLKLAMYKQFYEICIYNFGKSETLAEYKS